MAYEDIGDLFADGIPLPYRGKTYLVPFVDGKTGLRFERLKAVAMQAAKAIEDDEPLDTSELDQVLLDDENEVDLYQAALGPVYDEMLADHVPWEVIKVAAMSVWMRTTGSREAGEAYWNAAGNPELLAGNRASRRAARSTRQPGSAPGTTRTRKATTAKAGTRGRRSSNTGS